MRKSSRLVALVLCVALAMSVFAVVPLGAGAATESTAKTAYNSLITEYNKIKDKKGDYTASSFKNFTGTKSTTTLTNAYIIGVAGDDPSSYEVYNTIDKMQSLGGFKPQASEVDWSTYEADLLTLKSELENAKNATLVDAKDLKALIASINKQLGFTGSTSKPHADYASGAYNSAKNEWAGITVDDAGYEKIFFGNFSKIGTKAQPEIAAQDLVNLINALGAASVAAFDEGYAPKKADGTTPLTLDELKAEVKKALRPTQLGDSLYANLVFWTDDSETSTVEGILYLTDARKALKAASANGTGTSSDKSFRPLPNNVITGRFDGKKIGEVGNTIDPTVFYYITSDYSKYLNAKNMYVDGETSIGGTDIDLNGNDANSMYQSLFAGNFEKIAAVLGMNWTVSGKSISYNNSNVTGSYVAMYNALLDLGSADSNLVTREMLKVVTDSLKSDTDRLKPTWGSPYVTRYNQYKAQFNALDKNGYENKSYNSAQMALAMADMYYANSSTSDVNLDPNFQNAVDELERAVSEYDMTTRKGLISLKNLEDLIKLAKELVTKNPALLDDSAASKSFREALSKAEEALITSRQAGNSWTYETLYANPNSVYNNLRTQYMMHTPSSREALLNKAVEIFANGVCYDSTHESEIRNGVLCGKKHYSSKEWRTLILAVQKVMMFDTNGVGFSEADKKLQTINSSDFSEAAVNAALSNAGIDNKYDKCTDTVKATREAELEVSVNALVDLTDLMAEKAAVDKAKYEVDNKSSLDYNVAGMSASEQALRSSELGNVSNQAQQLLTNAANNGSSASTTHAAIVAGTIEQMKAALAKLPKLELTAANKALQTAALEGFEKLSKDNYTATDYAKGQKVYDELKACEVNSRIPSLSTRLNTLTSPYSAEMISIEANMKKVNDQLKVIADLRADPKMNKGAFAALDRTVEVVNNYIKNRVYSTDKNGVNGAEANSQLSKYVQTSYLTMGVPSQTAYADENINLLSAAAIFTCDSAYYDEIDAFNNTVAADFTEESYKAYKNVYDKLANFVPGTAVRIVSGYISYYDNATKELKVAREALKKGELDAELAKKLDEATKAAQALVDAKDNTGKSLYSSKSIARLESALKLDTTTSKAANDAIIALNKAVDDAEETYFNFTGKRFKGSWVKKGEIKAATIKTNFANGDITGKQITYKVKSSSPKVVQIGLLKPSTGSTFPKVGVKGLKATGNNYVNCALSATREGQELVHFFLVGVR